MATAFDDRYEPSVPPIGAGGVPPVVRKLLIVNLSIGLVGLVLGNIQATSGLVQFAMEWFGLEVRMWREHFPLVPLWQLVTYGFLHDIASPLHVLLNMLALYFFGGMLEQLIGSRRFLVFYLASIVFGGVAQLVYSLARDLSTPTVGASGAILFVTVAMAVLRPRTLVLFLFVPLQLWVLATVFVAIDLFSVLTQRASGTAHVVHLAGAGFGFAAAKLGWLWFDPVQAWESRRAEKVVEERRSDEERLDQLLERIHKDGIGSLSASERDFLRRMSARRGG